eukprot:CAMPEP_0181412756 /NCGR_PEP_ID=MMETSP1110-20121109/8596_1 /TAXON_ID=174948 /ORGANISM="Symbiodinium sp., Strain CCMP421" /LENGTH=301 /DNA_ID=CAMNT_0023535499 /DNA_START=30 /DNA_END=932 /DNA_ORIENTATION=-
MQMALRFSFHIAASVYLQDVLALRPELDASDSAKHVGGTRQTDVSYVEKMPLQRSESQYKATDCSGFHETQCEADVTQTVCSNMVAAVTNQHVSSGSTAQTRGKCYLKKGENTMRWEPEDIDFQRPSYQQLCLCRAKLVRYEITDADSPCRFLCYNDYTKYSFSEDLAKHECDAFHSDKYIFDSKRNICQVKKPGVQDHKDKKLCGCYGGKLAQRMVHAIWDFADAAKLCEAASEVYTLDPTEACDRSSAIAQRIVESKLVTEERASFLWQAKQGKCQLKPQGRARPTCSYQFSPEHAQTN